MGWMHTVAEWPLGLMIPFVVLWSIGCSWGLAPLDTPLRAARRV